MDTFRTGSLLAATITTGLMAGLFAAFSYSVMRGLARTDDRSFVAAMHGINVAILNGWFLVCFLGAPLLAAVTAFLHWRGGVSAPLPWILAGLALYLAGFVVTMALNVPLNNALDAAGALPADPASVRAAFEAPWVRWNLVRTVTTTAGFTCLAVALLKA